MSIVYRGDTPAKQMARQTGYQLAIGDIGTKRFSKEPHIVVSSQHCGDIVNYLFPRGILPANILACDIDPLAMVAADKLGVVLSPHPDIRDTVQWAREKYGERIATLNFDLCHTVLRVDLLEEALRHTPIKTPVLYTFVRGRSDKMQSQQERLKHLTKNIRANIQYLNYQSSDDTTIGSPMCMAVLNAIGDSWFWGDERDLTRIKIVDLDTNKQLHLASKVDMKPEPKVVFTKLPPLGISISRPSSPEIIAPRAKVIKEPKQKPKIIPAKLQSPDLCTEQPLTDDVLIWCNSVAGARKVLDDLQVEFPTRVFSLADCDIICNDGGSNIWLRRRALEIAVDKRAMWAL
jgi:hypothetical protein